MLSPLVEDLARVHDAAGVERRLDGAHGVDGRRALLPQQIGLLAGADAVLARARAAGREGPFYQLRVHSFEPLEVVGVVFIIIDEDAMEVPVARVPETRSDDSLLTDVALRGEIHRTAGGQGAPGAVCNLP